MLSAVINRILTFSPYPIPAPRRIESTFVRTSEYKTSFEKRDRDPTRTNRIEYVCPLTGTGDDEFECSGCSNFQSLRNENKLSIGSS